MKIGISPELWEQLDRLRALDAFTAEVREVLRHVGGPTPELSLVAARDLERGEVQLDTSDNGLLSPPSANDSPPAQVAHSSAEIRLMLVLDDQQVDLRESVTIGRSSSCDLVVRDTEASRRHAEVSCGTHGPLITDLESTNGTFVNDRRIETETTLAEGDNITIGATTVRVVRT